MPAACGMIQCRLFDMIALSEVNGVQSNGGGLGVNELRELRGDRAVERCLVAGGRHQRADAAALSGSSRRGFTFKSPRPYPTSMSGFVIP